MSGGYMSAYFESTRIELAALLELIDFTGEMPMVVDDGWVTAAFQGDYGRSWDETPRFTVNGTLVDVSGSWALDGGSFEVGQAELLIDKADPGARVEISYDGNGDNTWRRVKSDDGTVAEHWPVEVWPTDPQGDRDSILLAGAKPAPEFAPEGEPDGLRDLWNANMPRVSGCMYFAIPGEQPIHVSDEDALHILTYLSEQSR